MSRYDVDWDEMEDLAVVAPFFDELRTQFAEGPAPQIGTELATLFVFGAPPVGVVNPPKPASPRRNLRRVAACGVGGLALVAGMGAAGALPAPIQEPVANAAKFVGLNLPHPHHHRHPTPGGATDAGSSSGQDRSPAVTTHSHRSSHTPTDEHGDQSTVTSGDTSGTSGSGGATTGQTGTVTKRSGSGSSTTTGNSTVTGSGSAVSSTGGSGSGSGSGGSNGTNQHQRPTYHGNGRTTRDDRSSTSTTQPPSNGGGSTPTTSPPPSDTTPTTAAP